MSSSSSADTAPASVEHLLERALELMEGGCPLAFRELGRRLTGVSVRLTIDGETFDVRVEQGDPRVCRPNGTAAVHVRTSRAGVRAVLSGQTALAEAVRTDQVRADGRLRDLVALLDALETFVHGAVRTDAIERLYDGFRGERVA